MYFVFFGQLVNEVTGLDEIVGTVHALVKLVRTYMINHAFSILKN